MGFRKLPEVNYVGVEIRKMVIHNHKFVNGNNEKFIQKSSYFIYEK